eukprot:TRINITY_DN3674_c0_g2_i1.p1 TRINITY_DN3674_c0_g2~~TRINITY_DN3674_c0_g2_i1.p1  ORF type:complete len:669 (+),score=68.26 TRINITY_DN3674_c0_g2_i1:262-2007(+)
MVESPLLFRAIFLLTIHTVQGLQTDDMRAVISHRMSSVPSLRGLLQYDGANQQDGQSTTSYEEYTRMSTDGCDPYNEDCSQRGDTSPSPSQVEGEQQGYDLWTVIQEDVSSGSSSPSPTTYEGGSVCSNEQPPDATFSCSQYSTFGLCNDIQEEYCMEDCGRCIDCVDEYIPGTSDCNSILANGQCEAEGIKGVYCKQSCGHCPEGSGTPATQPEGPVQRRSSSQDCSQVDALGCDVSALMAFKDTVSGGESEFNNWVGDYPCDWKYVQCAQVEGEYKRVNKIDMDFQFIDKEDTITGSLVKEFSKLRYLSELIINNQVDITGELHPEFSVLEKLSILRIFRTGISGTLPQSYSAWNNIEYFAASYNSLSGTLPPGYSNWYRVQRVYLFGNSQMSGIIPAQYSTWSELLALELGEGRISGTFPVEFSTWAQIEYFDVGDVYITGTLPAQYSTWQLNQFDVHSNFVTGTLPPEYSTMTDMQEFSISGNEMVGSMPVEWSAWIMCCETFYLDTNELTGPLPPDYSTMSRMQEFEVEDNFLTGSLPVEYSTMKNIDDFYVYDNFITGDAPAEWSTWSDLVDMQL